ncbi:MAG TPA: sigma-54 dependent transcriptional regulator [Hyalangium sp.]|jgi:DNA-binding NtrC family response regulator|nr:sigma-54 dependent transcriptional regulator [Hyalangium sp.]
MPGVLVVEDEVKLGRLVAEALELDGFAVVRVAGGRAALVELAQRPFDVVLTDLKMPEVDGMAVLQTALALESPPAVVVMTAFGTTEGAVAAMKAGAADYLTKPFALDELRLRVRRLVEQRGAEAKSARLVQHLTPALVGNSPRMKTVLATAAQVALSDASVLLLGESGTGKTQLARLIHYKSRRASGPLVEVHCAALPEPLLESELFGYEKGAFTGAAERKVGHLAAAGSGTLFLDEIGEVTPATQVKLLRFLQDREFVPVGSTSARRVDTRVVSATNRDLAEAVREGRFREDFFYRLNVFAIEVPPLRERREDILPLAEAFLAARGLPPGKLSAGARERMVNHRWPGNVRELENALERGLILAGEGEVLAEHLGTGGPWLARGGSRAAEVLVEGFNLDAFERDLLHAALERAGGNKTAAARLLGITRRRLYSRLQSLDERLSDEDMED